MTIGIILIAFTLGYYYRDSKDKKRDIAFARGMATNMDQYARIVTLEFRNDELKKDIEVLEYYKREWSKIGGGANLRGLTRGLEEAEKKLNALGDSNDRGPIEEWRDIKGYEGAYQVSSSGRVKSLKRLVRSCGKRIRINKERFLIISEGKKGYGTVGLYLNSKIKTHSVHHLVAKAFILSKKKNKEVNHKNGNKLDNTVDNLEWLTP